MYKAITAIAGVALAFLSNGAVAQQLTNPKEIVQTVTATYIADLLKEMGAADATATLLDKEPAVSFTDGGVRHLILLDGCNADACASLGMLRGASDPAPLAKLNTLHKLQNYVTAFEIESGKVVLMRSVTVLGGVSRTHIALDIAMFTKLASDADKFISETPITSLPLMPTKPSTALLSQDLGLSAQDRVSVRKALKALVAQPPSLKR
jgi:hypothetical protein